MVQSRVSERRGYRAGANYDNKTNYLNKKGQSNELAFWFGRRCEIRTRDQRIKSSKSTYLNEAKWPALNHLRSLTNVETR